MSNPTPPAAPAAEPAAAPAAQPAAPAASPAPQPAAPASKGTVPATGKPGTFIANALKMLSGEDPSAPADAAPPASDTPPAPPVEKTADAPPAADPAAPAADDPDGEDAAARADVERETKNMPAAQKAAFTKLRYKLRDVQRQLKAASEVQKDQGGAANADPAVTAEVERLKAELDSKTAKLGEFEKEVFATRLELTDEFRAQVVAPRERVATEISEIAQRYEGIDQAAVIAAVQTGDSDRVSRVTADMNEFDRHTFYGLVREFQGIARTEAGLRANSKDALERISTERRAKTEAQLAAEKADWDKSLGSAWADLVETFPVLEPVENDPDWNGKLETVKAFATSDRFSKLTIKERAETLHRAAAFPVLVAELEATLAGLKEAQDKLSRYEAASPGLGASGAPDGAGSTVPTSGDFVSNALAALRKVGSR